MSSVQSLHQLVLALKTPDWCHRLLKDDYLEEKANPYMEIVLMPLEVRETFWSLATELVGEREAHSGIGSLACRLFERYCSDFVSKCDHMTSSEWENTKNVMKQRISLLMAICITLAYKVRTSQTALLGKSLLRTLRARGHMFALSDVKQAEVEVFEGLKFYIPLWSNWHKVQMIANEVGLSEPTVAGAGALMDLIDYKLPLIREQFTAVMSSPERASHSGEIGAEIRNAHLVASVVVAISRYMEPRGLELTMTLARWTRGSVYAIECLSEVIYQYFIVCVANKERVGKASKHPADPCSIYGSKRPRTDLHN